MIIDNGFGNFTSILDRFVVFGYNRILHISSTTRQKWYKNTKPIEYQSTSICALGIANTYSP